MKKKMGILAGLLMATVVTGYSVGGTYAKYTSSIDLADEARVAKWELVAKDGNNCKQVDGRWVCDKIEKITLFADSYYRNENDVYVRANNQGVDGEVSNLVAPGTKGEYQVNLAGAMEVKHQLNIGFNVEGGVDNEPLVKYNVVEKDDGTKEVKPDANGTYTYRPIKYSIRLGNFGTNDIRMEGTTKVSLPELQTVLATFNASNDKSIFAPGRLNQSLVISWEWDEVNKNVVAGDYTLTEADVNVLDTYIAEHWRENHPVAGNPGNDLGDGVKYVLSVTATQVTENYATNPATTR